MPDMNPELLKQLLAEFEEKQAVTTEEINEIEKQIEELRARIELSRDRLKEVERDREKVGAMKARYAEGDWTNVLQDLSRLKAQTPEPEPKSSPEPAIARAEKSSKKGKGGASESDNGKSAEPAAPQNPPAPPTPPPLLESAPEAPPTPPAPPALAPTMEMDMPQTLPGPAGNEGGLFSFSQAEQAAEMPWAPTPAMSWDSVNAQSFPDSTEPAQGGFAHTPDGNNPFLESAAKLGIPSPQSYGQPPQAPPGFNPPQGSGAAPDAPGAPGAPMPPAAVGAPAQTGSSGSQDVLSTAFNEEFDIAAALRGENEQGSEKDEGDVKKINDALRGLFS